MVAVTLLLANRDASLPVAFGSIFLRVGRRIRTSGTRPRYLRTKPEIALERIKAVRAAGLPEGVVLMDAVMAMTPSCER